MTNCDLSWTLKTKSVFQLFLAAQLSIKHLFTYILIWLFMIYTDN